MSKPFRPMLACKTPDESTLRKLIESKTMYMSPKLDGIRCIVMGGRAMSRTMKEIPNRYVQQCLHLAPEGLDGELIVGDPRSKTCYRNTNSGVMTEDGEPSFIYWTFDQVGVRPWVDRYNGIPTYKHAKQLLHERCYSYEDLLDYESRMTEAGYEGVMLRAADSPYKQGRSTEREGYLTKIKRFEDSEAIVLSVGELLHNDNEATTNELGQTKRSSHQSNKRPAGVMGYLTVRDLVTGVEFEVGTGFDTEMRRTMCIDQPIGKTIKYKYFPVGVKDKPRHPVFLGFRED